MQQNLTYVCYIYNNKAAAKYCTGTELEDLFLS